MNSFNISLMKINFSIGITNIRKSECYSSNKNLYTVTLRRKYDIRIKSKCYNMRGFFYNLLQILRNFQGKTIWKWRYPWWTKTKKAHKYGRIPGQCIKYPGYLHYPNISWYCLSLSISKIRFDFVFIGSKSYMKNCVKDDFYLRTWKTALHGRG